MKFMSIVICALWNQKAMFVEPKSYAEAANDVSWNKAMQIELSMIEKNHTWELVSRHSDKHVIGVEWVFKTKLNL